LKDTESCTLQSGGQFPADLVEHDGVIDGDGVAGESAGVLFSDSDAFARRIEALDLLQRCGVEGGRIVEERSVAQRREACVEMIEARIDQVQRDNFYVECLCEEGMTPSIRPHSVPRPENGSILGKERIALALEGYVRWQIEDGVAVLLKPGAEEGLFVAAFRMKEATGNEGPSSLQPCVGREDHVGQSRLRIDPFNRCKSGERFAESAPLLNCVTARSRMEIALHPRIDDVLHVVETRRAHQPACVCRRG